MANWIEVLGWTDEQLDDLRFVGYSYIRQGKWEIARTFFEALVLLAPTNAYDWQTLGAIRLQIGEHLMALNALDRSLKFDPIHLPTKLNRTKALFSLGYKKQALAEAESLSTCTDSHIASQAGALLLAHT